MGMGCEIVRDVGLVAANLQILVAAQLVASASENPAVEHLVYRV